VKSGRYIQTVIVSQNRNTSRDSNGGCAESGGINSNYNSKERKSMNDLDSGIEKLYQDYWAIHAEKLEKHAPLEVAAVLLAQAMSMYKTVLDHDDYNKMVDDIGRMRDQIKTLTPKQGNYH
jgi:hypothetical protein